MRNNSYGEGTERKASSSDVIWSKMINTANLFDLNGKVGLCSDLWYNQSNNKLEIRT